MGALRAGFHGTVGQPSAQVIDGSLKFHGDKEYYFKKTPYVGNRKTWTISFWVKRCEGSASEPGIFSTYAGVSGPAFTCYFNSADKLRIYNDESGYNLDLLTTQVFRDYNSWYHIVISIDTTQTTASDRAKLYVNGVRVTEFSTELYPGDIDLDWNTATEHNIGKHLHEFDGNISNFYHIDGHSFGPEYFGFTDPLTNTWRPKKLEQFPKRSFTNPRWYSSATLYTSVADVVANATDRGNGGVTVTNEYCYLVFNDGGYGTSGGESASPDYPVWSDVPSFSGVTRVFYYDSGEADNWVNAASYGSSAGEWNQWRYSNSATKPVSLAYRISPYMGIENGNMLVFCANANVNTPTLAGTLASITLPTFDTNSFHFQNAAVDTWYTGGNSFYLPFDGNSPIGKDKFNNGNDWTPVKFGGSNTIDKATGALPILNTTNGGNTATVGVKTDAFANNLVLALPLVGNENDVSNQINSGSTTKSVTANNNVSSSNTQSNFYEGSFYFDGNATETSAKYLEVASGLDFSQDFTVEMWFYKTTTQDYGVLFDCWNAQTSGDGWYSWIAGGRIDIVKDSSTYYYGSGDSVILDDTWNHVAYVRDNNVFKVFSNGVFQYSFNITDSWTSTKCWIGSGQGNTSMAGFYGYIQDVRIYETAKYTENFIPASTNPDILSDTPSGVSGGSKLAKNTSGSVSFDGNGDSLSIADSADFTFGSGDFTMEAFVYCNNASTNAHKSIINKYTTNQASSSWFWSIINGLQYFYFYYDYDSSEVFTYSNTTLPNRKWVHCAIVRDGNTLRLFQDGVQINGGVSNTGDVTGLTINDSSVALTIGEDGDNNYDMDGFISNARVIKGTALYTSNFTPPAEPLTNVTNTTLLCCQSNKLAGTAAVSPSISGGLNDGTVWSEEGQSVNVAASTPMAYAFDGSTTSYVLPVNNTTMRYDFPHLITGTKFEIFNSVSLATNGFSVNGQPSANVAGAQSSVWSDVTDAVTASGLGGLSYITMGYVSSNWSQVVYAFRVDDVILVDPVSAVNAKASTLNPFNTDINTVRGQETNHCTWNPLHTLGTYTQTYQYSNGNLDFTTTGSPNLGGAATIGVKSGRWYWEIIHTELANNNYDTATYVAYDTFNRFTARDRGIAYLANGQKKMNDVNTDYGETYTTNDVIGVALDADNDKVTYFKNGRNQGELSITQLTTNTGYYPAIHQVNGSNNLTGSANFGQKPFKFPPPDGYQPLNNANVRPETVIARPDQYVGVTTYPGTQLTQSIDHFNFKPDLAWIKVTDNQRSNFLFDSVRSAENYLISDSDGMQVNDSTTLTSFDLNGFTVGTSPDVNRDTSEIVAWAWKAGGDKNTFNVDDVGYANASDVNMNAGALNSTIYDQSATWSTNSTMTLASGAFDGTDVGSSGNANYSSSGEVLTSSSITINNKLEIYTNRTHTGTTDGTKITINGTDYYDKPLASTGWSEIDLSGATLPLTTTGNITITDTQGTSGLWSVRVDGKRLVDSNATPPNLPAISATGCSIGTKQGFSIVKYTGSGTDNDEVPHGLSQKPDFVIVKNITTSDTDWRVWSSGYGDNRNLRLNKIGDREYWNEGNIYGHTSSDTAITLSCAPSTNLSDDVNLSGDEYIMYSWHNVPGLQKFGVYTGNGDADGTYVELGFRPALVIVKLATIASGSANWFIYDSKMEKYNPINKHLIANSSGIIGTGYPIDFLSNGFKLRYADTGGYTNLANTEFIYAAWAETPAINLYGATSNAR